MAGPGGLVNLGTFATLQQFLNDQNRLLYAQTAWGELVHGFGRNLRGRLTGTMDYFNDSERDTVRSFSEALEVGLSLLRSGWSAEFWGGLGGRQYPKLTTIETGTMSMSTTAYSEGTWSGGMTMRFSPVERLG